MSQIVIAGNFALPRNLGLGDELTITGTVSVKGAYIEQIDITGPGDREPRYADGEIHVEANAISIKVTS